MVVVELTAPLPEVRFGSTPTVRVLVTHRGVAVAYPELGNPGQGNEAAILEAVAAPLRRVLEGRDELERRLARRLDLPTPDPPQLACSVVVCTHQRPRYIPELLRGLTRLDPPPAEIIIVDNAPGGDDCRAAVVAAGARYVREDRKGLDRARKAGLEAATGDIVVYTDDDCVPPPGWLRHLPRFFDDPSVGAVTGPAFAWSIESPAQARFERDDGFRRGLSHRRSDWLSLPPVNASSAGAGANMAFRASALRALGDPFPDELDAGTPTQSGGDMYAFARLLAAGQRIVYAPAAWTFHQHRPDPPALHEAIRGYGLGLTSALLKLLLAHREIEALRAWTWITGQYARALRRRATGEADAIRVRLAWEYVRGGLQAPAAYRRSRAQLRDDPRPPALAPVPKPAPVVRRSMPGGDPAVTVVVPSLRRPAALAALLGSLDAQSGDIAFEVVVVDDDPRSDGSALRRAIPEGLPATVLAGGGNGAAAARNLGARHARADLLLFLDDDMLAAPGLVREHVTGHADHPQRIVVGDVPPEPARDTLAAHMSTLWWQDYLHLRRSATGSSFQDVLSGNMSIRREVFLELGGFDARYAAFRREDWDFGLRALKAGCDVAFRAGAGAPHRFELDTRRFVEDGYREGRGDALIAADHPEATAVVAPAKRLKGWKLLRWPVDGGLDRLFATPGRRRALSPVLDVLERVNARRPWLRLARAARHSAYVQGTLDGPPRPPGRAPALEIALDGDSPVPGPGIALGPLRLTEGGKEICRVQAPFGLLHAGIVRDLVEAVPAELLPLAPSADAGRPRLDDVAVVVSEGSEAGWDGTGAQLAPVTGAFWPSVERLVEQTSRRFLAIPLPGVQVTPGWAGRARDIVAASDVGALQGVGCADVRAETPLGMYSRRIAPSLRGVGMPPQAVMLDVEACRAVGGIDAGLERAHRLAPVIDLVARLLDAGRVVGSVRWTGVTPPRSRRAELEAERERHRAVAAVALMRATSRAAAPDTRRAARQALLRPMVGLAAAPWPGTRGRRRRLDHAVAALHGCATAAPALAARRPGPAG